MRSFPLGALPCLLALQVAAQPPLTYDDIQARARTAPEQLRAQALLAENRALLQESRGFLREGPTLSVAAGPRRQGGLPGSTDREVEIDLPLFLSPGSRAALEAGLGQAHPLLLEASAREGRFRLRTAYLEAWLAERLLALREADQATVERWLQAARARLEAGADPAFQVALVEGERLKVLQELDEARIQRARAWGQLRALADLPAAPQPLAGPGDPPPLGGDDLERRLAESPLRKALQAQAELEAGALRLREAQARQRWSLRGSYASEGEEKVARLGLAFRLPRPGEAAALRSGTETRLRSLEGESRQALAEFDARTAALLERVQKSGNTPSAPDFSQALEAVGLRLQEGKERPSDALPIRRALLDAQMADLRRQYARQLLAAELQLLMSDTTGQGPVNPSEVKR